MIRLITILIVAGSIVACTGKAPRVPAGTASAESASGRQLDGALSLVREYVQRDSRGERLGPAPWFTSVVTWHDDPGYDSYTAIASFEVTPLSTGRGDTARVRVVYHTAGWIVAGDSMHTRFMPHDTVEAQIFTVIRAGDTWRIAAPQIGQHVLIDSALTMSSLGTDDRKKLQAARKQ